MQTIDRLMCRLRNHVEPFYRKNGASHNINHADNVAKMALMMTQHDNPLTVIDRSVLVIAAYFHDKFATNRERHHILAHDDLRRNAARYASQFDVSLKQIRLAATCCLEHRSSNIETATSVESEVIRAAVIGLHPMSKEAIYKRRFLFNRSTMNREDAIQEAIKYNKSYRIKNTFYIKHFGFAVDVRNLIVSETDRSSFSDEILDQWETEL